MVGSPHRRVLLTGRVMRPTIHGMDTNGADLFLVRARERLESLGRDDAALAAQEEGVKRKRSELQSAMTDVRRSVETYRELMGIGETPAPGQMTTVLDASDGVMTLRDMAYNLIVEHGGRARVTDLVTWIHDAGRLSGSDQSNYSSVYTALLRDPRIEKTGRGEWGVRVPTPAKP